MKSSYYISIALFAVFVASCSLSPASGAANAMQSNETVNAAPAATPMAAVGKANLPAPESVVEALYKTHDAHKSPFFQSKDRALLNRFFSKTIADLIWKDATTHTSDVGAIGADPLYDAQDIEIKNFRIGESTIKGDKATVPVTFTNFGESKTITFQLSAGTDSWKIDDIVYSGGDSLMKWLKEEYSDTSKSDASGFAGKYTIGTTSCTVKKVGENYEVRWAKGTGVEVFEPTLDALAFNATTRDGGVNSFSFDDESYDTGTFYRADGKTFPIKRSR